MVRRKDKIHPGLNPGGLVAQGHEHDVYRASDLFIRVPRYGAHPYDSRSLKRGHEPRLVAELNGGGLPVPHVAWIPAYGAIPGGSVRSVFPEGRALDDRTFRQILDFLRQLTAVDLSDATLRGHFEGLGPWPQSDSALFLRNRIDHTHTHVYLKEPTRYHSLFTRLGVAPDVLPAFKEALPKLTPRPYRLLHGDLHRGNLVYDRASRIIVIDWSLACMGDPLYDLATLLHLMELPPAQEIKMKARWSRVVEQACAGASRGYADDLKAYLDFKRLESVFTDVHRAADAFGEESTPANLYRSTRMIRRSLARARGPLRLPWVPSRAFVMRLLCSWRILNGNQRFPRTANQPQFGRPYGLTPSQAEPSGRHRRVPGEARDTRDTPPPAIVRAASADRSRLMP